MLFSEEEDSDQIIEGLYGILCEGPKISLMDLDLLNWKDWTFIAILFIVMDILLPLYMIFS